MTAADQIAKVIDDLTAMGTAVARADGSRHTVFPVAISPEEGAALRQWVLDEQATRTIEIGLGYGISALHICHGLCLNGDPDARHVVIDPYQATRFADCGLQFLDDAGVGPMVEHHAEESQITLARFLAEDRRFDLAFVDGNHRFDGVFVDLYYLGRLVRPGGVIILDDHQLPGIAKAVSFFAENLGWTVEEVSAEDDVHQWAVVRTARSADQRPFHHFVDF